MLLYEEIIFPRCILCGPVFPIDEELVITLLLLACSFTFVAPTKTIVFFPIIMFLFQKLSSNVTEIDTFITYSNSSV